MSKKFLSQYPPKLWPCVFLCYVHRQCGLEGQVKATIFLLPIINLSKMRFPFLESKESASQNKRPRSILGGFSRNSFRKIEPSPHATSGVVFFALLWFLLEINIVKCLFCFASSLQLHILSTWAVTQLTHLLSWQFTFLILFC